MIKYKCTCTSGGGTKQTSFWNVKITPKSMRLECYNIKTIWGSAEEGQKLIVNLTGKNKKHCLRIWNEDLSDFTIYPYQAGTPFHFEKLST